MTTTTPRARQPVPELEAAKLYRQIGMARATVAGQEAETAREHLAALEAEYKAVKRECVL